MSKKALFGLVLLFLIVLTVFVLALVMISDVKLRKKTVDGMGWFLAVASAVGLVGLGAVTYDLKESSY